MLTWTDCVELSELTEDEIESAIEEIRATIQKYSK